MRCVNRPRSAGWPLESTSTSDEMLPAGQHRHPRHVPHEDTRSRPEMSGTSVRVMADAIFEERRLAEVYDPLDPDRSDLDAYMAIVNEFNARSVLDIGCGTGTFACLLARHGIEVTGVDPAGASLDVARAKPGADTVRWLHGDAATLPPMQVDLAVMTCNVAQVFLTMTTGRRPCGAAMSRSGRAGT
jgi:SAM-dependent methyltransferase